MHTGMTESIGIDIVEVARIQKLVERYGNRFLGRVYGPDERTAMLSRHDRFAFLAGRFAAKEAAIKALGKFLSVRPPYHEIEIVNDKTGQPWLQLTDTVTATLNRHEFHVSISHERSHAVALVTIREI
jgi:holo-[acyl-carrier protein] synthase